MEDVETIEVYANIASVNAAYGILYFDRSSEDEQLLIRVLLQKKNLGG
jgi:hypothetical protein